VVPEDLDDVVEIDPTMAHSARMYDYLLGGSTNFEVDRLAVDRATAAVGGIDNARASARANRAFLGRAVRFLAGEAGVRQFLDIGTGIPGSDGWQADPQQIAPEARVVYVDNDPIVLAHARALLTSTPEGATAYIDADLRDPERILSHPDLLRTIDLGQPVALMLVAILHFLPDPDQPYDVVRRLLEALPSGSYLAASHATYDHLPEQVAQESIAATRTGGAHNVISLRSRAEFAGFFAGLELVDPGIVSIAQWRAEREPLPRPSVVDVSMYGAVARKP
jgi:hypothetical protein